jgi:excinuclease ABC subunit A
VIVIEHNLDVIKTADWVVDMGPEGGSGGGLVVAEGTPEQVAAVPESHTGKFLRDILPVDSIDAAPARKRAGKVPGQSPADKAADNGGTARRTAARKAAAGAK